MAYVITGKCLGERYGQCVETCPTDSIHPGEYKGEVFMAIDPDTCIACGACKPQCPIDSIVESEGESPEWAAINKEVTATFKNNPKVAVRPANDPPKKPTNKLH